MCRRSNTELEESWSDLDADRCQRVSGRTFTPRMHQSPMWCWLRVLLREQGSTGIKGQKSRPVEEAAASSKGLDHLELHADRRRQALGRTFSRPHGIWRVWVCLRNLVVLCSRSPTLEELSSPLSRSVAIGSLPCEDLCSVRFAVMEACSRESSA